MKTLLIVQLQRHWNPYFINGHHEINDVHIYAGGKSLVHFRWLSNGGSNNDYPLLEIDADIRKANKIDMARNDMFYVRHDDSYSRTAKYDIFIPAELVQFKQLKERVAWKNKTQVCYKREFSINLPTYKQYAVNIVDEKPVWSEEEKHGELKFSLHARTETTDFGKKCNNLSKEIKAKCNVDLSRYDLEKILIKYNIEKK